MVPVWLVCCFLGAGKGWEGGKARVNSEGGGEQHQAAQRGTGPAHSYWDLVTAQRWHEGTVRWTSKPFIMGFFFALKWKCLSLTATLQLLVLVLTTQVCGQAQKQKLYCTHSFFLIFECIAKWINSLHGWVHLRGMYLGPHPSFSMTPQLSLHDGTMFQCPVMLDMLVLLRL